MTVSDQNTAHNVVLTAQPDAATVSGFVNWTNTGSGSDFEGPLLISDPSLTLIAESGRNYSYLATFASAPKK
jgi:hypothetical protein